MSKSVPPACGCWFRCGPFVQRACPAARSDTGGSRAASCRRSCRCRRVVGPAPEVAGVEPVADVLIDLPGDAGLLQALGIGGPVVAGFGVVDDRAAALAVVADPAGPHVVAVRVGRAEQRAVVGVADREGVGQRVVERDVAAGEVRHRRRALVAGPTGRSCRRSRRRAWWSSRAARSSQELQAEVRRAGMEGQHVLLPPLGWYQTGLPDGQRDGARVAEAAHAAQRAEVVIERAVLLHQDDDVLDVVDRAGAIVGGNRERPGDAGGEGCGEGGGA